jgi:signal transduction histidine kinase
MDKASSLFETVMASTVHDMKNSLSLVIAQLEQISEHIEETEDKKIVSTLRYESSRINLSLMQMLALYKLDKDQLNVRSVEVELIDFIEDCVAAQMPLAKNSNIELEIDCDELLVWFFDPDLVSIAINNIIGNSIRYTKSTVKISVRQDHSSSHKGLIIEISDDGSGYPEIMLLDPEIYINTLNHSTGSTGLGIFFSATIAAMHIQNGISGHISLDNKNSWNGGRFQLFLP